jgi:hypothetical protein
VYEISVFVNHEQIIERAICLIVWVACVRMCVIAFLEITGTYISSHHRIIVFKHHRVKTDHRENLVFAYGRNCEIAWLRMCVIAWLRF